MQMLLPTLGKKSIQHILLKNQSESLSLLETELQEGSETMVTNRSLMRDEDTLLSLIFMEMTHIMITCLLLLNTKASNKKTWN